MKIFILGTFTMVSAFSNIGNQSKATCYTLDATALLDQKTNYTHSKIAPDRVGRDLINRPTDHKSRHRVAIFIDGSNLFYAAAQLGIEIDYTKLLRHLVGNMQLLRAFFYTGVDRHNERQQGFLLWMRHHGYRVITKDLVHLPDGSKKANLDIEIAVDMMTLVEHYDTAVLVSGDGDLAYAVNAISYRGVRVEVISLKAMTSDSLINVADRYYDLDAIKHLVQKGGEGSSEVKG
jgi:uncharacterized LabA/DUF88 family protein